MAASVAGSVTAAAAAAVVSPQYRVMAIDVGVRNLAYCILSREEVVDWSVVDCIPTITNSKTVPVRRLRQGVIGVLDGLLDALLGYELDLVAIEQQPTRNQRMVCLQHVIETWFALRMPEVKVECMSPRLKLSLVDVDTQTYHDRKRAAVEETRRLFRERQWSLAFFEGHRKKDDLADTFLMADYALQYGTKGPGRKNKNKKDKDRT
jgi:hypothetical protein